VADRLDLVGAVTAYVIYVSSIVTFAARMLFDVRPGNWIGIPFLLTAFPLVYLLMKAPASGRPLLYYVQVGLMLSSIIVLFILDYMLDLERREVRWATIALVVLYFGGLGGMIGVASEAGRGWMIAAVLLFLVTGVLAFVQRSVTGF
jgi:hypothetical protein